MEFFIGTIMPFPYNFVPQGWLACNGQTLPVQQYQPLFSLIGVAYGGNGQTNFNLPALNNPNNPLVVAGMGDGPGLTSRKMGQVVGEASHTLTQNEVPAHNHNVTIFNVGTQAAATTAAPVAGGVLTNNVQSFVAPNPASQVSLNTAQVSPVGAGQSHENRQPYVQMVYCICWDGIYPNFG